MAIAFEPALDRFAAGDRAQPDRRRDIIAIDR